MRNGDRLVRDRIRESFVVTLDTDETFAGVLYAADDRSLILREAQVLTENGPRSPIDGELVLPRSRVLYLQRLDPVRI